MQICDTKEHGEIVYDEKYCPACTHILRLESQIANLEEQIYDLQDENKELIAELEAGK